MQIYLRIDGPAFCSIFQGSTRWNSFVAIALAADMFGKQGLALAAVASVAMIPLLNIMAVLVHARYASGKPAAPPALTMTLIKNPFIWSTLLGIGWNLLAIPMPKFGAVTLDIVGRAALSAGLLCVGAGSGTDAYPPRRAATRDQYRSQTCADAGDRDHAGENVRRHRCGLHRHIDRRIRACRQCILPVGPPAGRRPRLHGRNPVGADIAGCLDDIRP